MSTTWAGSNIYYNANKMSIAAKRNAPTPKRKPKSCRSKAKKCALRLLKQLLLKACYVAPRNFVHPWMMCASKIRSQSCASQHQHLVARLPYRVKSSLRTTAPLKSLPMSLALSIRALALSSLDLTVLVRQLSLRFWLTNLNPIPEKWSTATD
ncbi:unannotated protein [freshwater metagenome]|uniref:Unannotated protein n=1 Tax=freshwater metagenome TaxID=449393 RepID=A0A6J7NRG3_9ZZZZ